ncbi:MAG TPA: ankyrin repeat domain-containing protein [Bryobacteraceae bacterium]|nr:ankyrin repeat domain-containing protein [Bryobacteraceae bacterium]
MFAQLPDFTPPTPLLGAILRNDTVGVKRLLAQGADPNEERFAGFPPIFFPVMFQDSEMFRILVEKGADVQLRDRLGSTTLMWAAFNETGKTELVEQLLALGVDPNARNQNGETALTWALRRGYTPVAAALRKGGASDESMIKDSVERAISLLQKSGPQFVKVSGCTSCHHQSLPQMVASLARERGFRVDERLAQQQTKAVMAMFRPLREIMAQGTQKVPDPPVTVSYALVGLAAEGYAPDATTEAMAHLVSTVQFPDGSFRALPARPPMEASDFTATALSLRALQLYGKDPEERVAKALHWLTSAKPQTNEDRSMRLLGMTWGKADSQRLRTAALDLLREQRQDGGWGQTAALETDAYATGQALVALRWSGEMAASDPAYQRGVAYLLRTQLSDGSWHVRTRAFPFQQYKESGFPHGVDQWISAAGSSWAAMALTLSAPAMGQEVSGF